MNISRHVKTYRGTECHSIKQVEYLNYKKSLLNNLCGKEILETTIVNGRKYYKKVFCIRPNTNLKKLYELFYYNNGKKDVPNDLALLTPLAVSMWFMDDGFVAKTQSGQNLGFSTCSFSFDGLYRLQSFFQRKIQYRNYC